jgi:hypothetical protein
MLRILIADGRPSAKRSGFPRTRRSSKPHLSRNSLISNARRSMLPMAKTCRMARRLEISTANVQRFAAAYLRPDARGDTPNRFCAGSVYDGPARMGKLLGPAACDRGTWGNRPPQSPWSRARSCQSDSWRPASRLVQDQCSRSLPQGLDGVLGDHVLQHAHLTRRSRCRRSRRWPWRPYPRARWIGDWFMLRTVTKI